MIIKTLEYEFNHGKKPRGSGFWCVEVIYRDGKKKTLWKDGKLGDICKQLKSENAQQVTIQP